MYMIRQILHISNLSKSKRKCQLLCSLKFKEYIFNKKKKKKEKEKEKIKYFFLFKTCSSRTYIWHKSKIDNQLCELVWLCI